ncbi:excinuclease ABC subunit UvrC [Dictyoglomus thermophilum]|uniref:UvrABC system protein C n=1 Tax=Dictyoglomus thermophilum (strain ATCC 35947 / DSM 3960 / H-6-12) TaxID=309799 RepID=UVRC_DICT6|nr:excinuclease ABC subunit UvrC [Dictyoglomus thermophilum]B5YF86.1 RecName: Full=UvrABC system protein C; Short=Protein UvrC; AltName: Full=Excinuclease ABC subunit C [Dictyoglomus thermophilum H-6-12]ACI20004.1 excinuclease ABC, C subunit [Dictyoglomus thermophilum H-6-12]
MRNDFFIMDLKQKVENFPESTGVYIFYDHSGKVIYVGKAKNLRKRVLSYFNDDSPKSNYILKKAKNIEFYITDTETEALILESVLIKKYRPIMNVQLRDDKQYPMLKLTLYEEYPRLVLARRFEDDGARYYGPYTQSGTVRETISMVKKIFNLRSCNWNLPKSKPKRPCLNYFIGNCKAPCQNYITKEEYWEIVKGVIDFLDGKYEEIIEKLYDQMQEYSKNLEFEKAAKIRDKIRLLQNLSEKQKIVSFNRENKDLIQFYVEDHKAKALVYLIREGKLIEKRIFNLTLPEICSNDELIESFVLQYYSRGEIPEVIVVPSPFSEEEVNLKEFLCKRKGSEVVLRTPENEEEEKLLGMALKDLTIESIKSEKVWLALSELQRIFNLQNLPVSIEGYDISNLQGREAVGSRVYFQNGYPEKTKYRRYKIKYTPELPNDYLMLQEVIRRRLKNIEEDPLPDIMLIDGGKGQLSAVLEVFNELKIEPKFILALAKEKEEIFVPGRSEPILLSYDSPALHLLQQVRDEAHRFAVSYHRKLRSKKLMDSHLDKIPGVGEKRMKILLEAFSTLENLKKASLEDLKKVPGISEKIAEKIYLYFHDSS